MIKCVGFAASAPWFKSSTCHDLGKLFSFFYLTFPICKMGKYHIALSHSLLTVRTKLVHSSKDLEECCAHRELLEIKTFATWGVWSRPKRHFTMFRKHIADEAHPPSDSRAETSSFLCCSLWLLWILSASHHLVGPDSSSDLGWDPCPRVRISMHSSWDRG